MPRTKELDSTPRTLSSKENRAFGEIGETSFRVYYGATGAAVPFMWESQPGTPKHPIFRNSHDGDDNCVPPLTPPPSYTTPSLTLGHTTGKCQKSSSRIFDIIFNSSSRKTSNGAPIGHMSSLSSLMSKSTTSSSSRSLSPPSLGGGRKSKKSHRRSISFCSVGATSPLIGDEHHNDMGSPNSAMCFGFKKKYQGCYSMQHMKNAILSLRGH